MNIPHDKERRLTDYFAEKAIHMKLPLSGTFELSPACNFSCKMCYVRKTQKQIEESPRRILTLEEWRSIALEARKAGTLYLLLTGGEPLLWPDFWTLYEELIDLGFIITINTNATLIDEDAVERFRKHPPHKINITLYGANDITYQKLCGTKDVFSKVDSVICQLLDSKITIKLNCSLTPDNAKDLDWIVAYAKEKGIKITVATYMFPPVRRDSSRIGENERFTPEECAKYMLRYLELDRDKESFYRYLQSIIDGCVDPPGLEEGCVDPLDGKIRCRAGRSSFWITWDGWITPCGMMPDPKVDLKEESFQNAWKTITDLSDSMHLSGICNSCPNMKICHPCAAIAYTETGKISGIPSYMCEVVKEMRKLAYEKIKMIENQSIYEKEEMK